LHAKVRRRLMRECVQLVCIGSTADRALHPNGHFRGIKDRGRLLPLVLYCVHHRRLKIAHGRCVPSTAGRPRIVHLRHCLLTGVPGSVRIGAFFPKVWIAVQDRQEIIRGRDVRSALGGFVDAPRRRDHVVRQEQEDEQQQGDRDQDLEHRYAAKLSRP